MTLTLNFQGQIWNLLYLGQKLFDCHETKKKKIDWTLSLKCDHWIWPWPWIFKVKFAAISRPQNGPIGTKQKTNILIELYASNATIGFDRDLDLEFSRSNMKFAISCPKMIRLPQNQNHTYRLNSKPQMWPSNLTLAVTLTLNFQGQILNLLYLSQKWPNCHKTKSKRIEWTLCLKCDHWIWPSPWPWPWIFKVKFGICYISAKNGLIATKWKVHI